MGATRPRAVVDAVKEVCSIHGCEMDGEYCPVCERCAMSDLIERLRDNQTSTCGPHAKQLMNKAADALEAKDAEIERLNKEVAYNRKDMHALRDECRRLEGYNAKLQAVVDAHIKYGLFCDECIEAGRTECVGHVDGQPLAALEGQDDE